MTKLKKYNTIEEWETAKSGLVYPSVGLVEDGRVVYKKRPISVGDVAYYNGTDVKTVPYSKYDSSLGTPIGVVVVPEGFATDGKVRIVALNDANSGNTTMWGSQTYYDIPKINNIATTDNISYDIQLSYGGKLPSDKFDGVVSYVDPISKYTSDANWSTYGYIPSPYLNGVRNEYLTSKSSVSGGNAAAEFSDITSIDRLLNKGITAARVAHGYSDGVTSTTWFLPQVGELLYIMPRFNVINETINLLGGVAIQSSASYWSATQKSNDVWVLNTGTGVFNGWSAPQKLYVRPFAILE